MVLVTCEDGTVKEFHCGSIDLVRSSSIIEEVGEYAINNPVHAAFHCGMNDIVVVEYDRCVVCYRMESLLCYRIQ